MAEKKKSWFGRLFGGKKDETPANVDVAETAQETPNVESSDHKEHEVNTTATETVDSIPTEENAQSPTSLKEEAEHIVETVVDAVKAEFEETVTPAQEDENSSKAKEIAPQHQVLEEIAEAAKAEIEVFETAESEIEETPQIVETHFTDPKEVELQEEPKADAMTIHEHELAEEDKIPQEVDAILIDPQHETETDIIDETVENFTEETAQATQEKPEKKTGFFARLSSKLSKTRNSLTEGIADLFLGKKEISEEILEELETRLLMADVGINVTDQMLTSIRDSVSRKSLSNVDELFAALKIQMKDILEPVSKPLVIDTNHKPYVILMIGVNGVGKTTTIGKLAKKFQLEGKSVMLAAGDTFRAAAVEQLEIWGERNNIPVISQKEGADPASVIFDAMESAKARKADILIADTAGRLHTDSGLMQELAKINRVIKRHDETAPHEVMLVVDASTGQNALNQARQFNTTVPLSGITFTKLDGTAKGGIIFAIAEELNIPIRFIGVGESIDDLRPFDSDEFVDALISTEKMS